MGENDYHYSHLSREEAERAFSDSRREPSGQKFMGPGDVLSSEDTGNDGWVQILGVVGAVVRVI